MDIIKRLEAVLYTMDTIPVAKIENQSKFVGCAEQIAGVVQYLREAQAKKDAPAPAGAGNTPKPVGGKEKT